MVLLHLTKAALRFNRKTNLIELKQIGRANKIPWIRAGFNIIKQLSILSSFRLSELTETGGQ